MARLLRYLSAVGLPSRVDTKQIAAHFGRPWREFSGDLTRRQDLDTLLANAGWRYVRMRGSGGACFERLEGALGNEEQLHVHRSRLIDLILSQAL
jgi:hypothetical protein